MKQLAQIAIVVLFISSLSIAAAQDNARLTISRDNAAALRLLETRATSNAQAVQWSPDARRLAIGTARHLEVVDNITQASLWTLEARNITHLSWSYDNAMLVAMHDTGKVTVFNASTGSPIVAISAATPTVAVFSPTDNVLAYNDGSRLYLASMQFGVSTRHWQMPAPIRDIEWTDDGRQLAVVAQRHVLVWDITAEREVFRVTSSDSRRVEQVEWRPAATILTTIESATIQLYDSASRTQPLSLRAHEDAVRDIDWSPDGRLLASVAADSRLLVWDVDAARIVTERAIGAAVGVAWSPDGTQIMTVSADEIAFWGVVHEGAPVATDATRK